MSSKSNNSGGIDPINHQFRHEKGPGPSMIGLAFLAILIANLFLIPMAMFAMGEETGPGASLKYLLVGFAAAGAAFGVNRFSVDHLAPLHAIGFNLAGALAISFILVTGVGTAIGSFTGVAFRSVEVKVYQLAGKDLSALIGNANELALASDRITPSVEAIAQDIAQTEECEEASSCFSNQGNGGRGPMSRALGVAAGRAFTVVEALRNGALEQERLLRKLNRLNTEYHEELARSGYSAAERRAALQSVHSELRQVASALIEAMPITLVQGYVDELRGGATVQGNPAGSRRLSAYLSDHAETLADQLAGLPETGLEPPQFPDRPGMIEVLQYLPTYLAVAAIIIVGELCLPITIYLMTYMRRVREIEILEDGARSAPPVDPFEGLIDRSKGDGSEPKGPTS